MCVKVVANQSGRICETVYIWLTNFRMIKMYKSHYLLIPFQVPTTLFCIQLGWRTLFLWEINTLGFFGRPFVKWFALCCRTIVLSDCLSVTLVYCGQTAGWIKMKLGTEVGLVSGHMVLDGEQKGYRPCPNFRPVSVVAKRSATSATAEHF